ncbi:MAG TPA: glucose PTS transporter subunit EIIB, partial [Steroidobacteraceae bacterium]
LLPVGAVYFALYYGLFRWVIVRFDLKTPGRDRTEPSAAAPPTAPRPRAAAWIAALGGGTNLKSVDACTTRLRLIVASQSAVDTEALRSLGARGLVRPSAEALQVVVGATADQLAGELRAALQSGELAGAADAAATHAVTSVGVSSPGPGAITAQMSGQAWPGDAAAVLAALGGRDNVREVSTAASRLRIGIADAARLDRGALGTLGLRGVAVPRSNCVHLLVGPEAEAAAAALRHLLNTRLVRSGAP